MTVRHSESGAALLEFTVVIMVFLLVLFGTVEFSYMFYQWNAAAKAVQFGARLAAVSPPIASDLETYTGVGGSVLPGDPLPANAYDRICTSESPTGDTGICTGVNSYSAAAMRSLVFGRGNTTCINPPQNQLAIGMCNILLRNPPITPANVRVRYQYTGLGYAGRPDGPVPTITVELRNLTFNYIFLNSLLGFTPVTLPGFSTTVTGEDLGNGV